METNSIRLFLALFLIIWGLGIAINREYWCKAIDDTIDHPAIQMLMALIPLILGSFIVATHNIWTLNLGLIVTLLGWAMLVGGAFRTVLTKYFVAMLRKFKSSRTLLISGLISAALGLILLSPIS
jgi:hypothetical protein